MKLLLAEDERDLASAIKRVLEYSKYDVDIAYDGVEALEKIDINDYDALILDVMMPRMDGFTVVKKLREAGNSIPVLILTARSETDDKVLGLDYGADDYLTKPFQIKELLARIRALLRRKGDVSESYSIGNVSLNHETFELKAVSSVRLTNKEYKMMEYLIMNKGSLLSTEKLMEKIWDFDSEAEINVVWAYISALRKKLEQIGADVTIKAVRGVGYQLAEKNDKEPQD